MTSSNRPGWRQWPAAGRVVRAAVAGLLLAGAGASSGAAQDGPGTAPVRFTPRTGMANRCLAAARSVEQSLDRFPAGMLEAAVTNLTGLPTVAGTRAPWPWSLAHGRQRKAVAGLGEAVREALRLMDEEPDRRDLRVGCMLINWRAHAEDLGSFRDAFDPLTNVQIGAQDLLEAYARAGESWEGGLQLYFAQIGPDAEAFAQRVMFDALGQRGPRPPEPPPVADAAGDPDAGTAGVVPPIQVRRHPIDQAADLFAEERYEDALRMFDSVLEADPDNSTALAGRAFALEQLGRAGEALEAYRATLRAAPDQVMVLLRLIRVADALPPQVARSHLETVARLTPERPEAPARLAQLALAMGDINAAAGYAAVAAERAPDDPLYRLNHAVLLDRLERWDEAVAVYQQVLQMDGTSGPDRGIPLDQIRRRAAFLQRRIN